MKKSRKSKKRSAKKRKPQLDVNQLAGGLIQPTISVSKTLDAALSNSTSLLIYDYN